MRPLIGSLVLLALCLGRSSRVGAQPLLVLDLGSQSAGSSNTESVRPGIYGIRIDSRIPAMNYSVGVLVRAVPITPLDVRIVSAGGGACEPLQGLRRALGGTSESDVRIAVAKASAALGSDQACAAHAEAIRLLINDSRIPWEKDVELSAGQELVVTVVRSAKGTEAEKRWEKTFTTGPRGEWRATYGFATAFTRLGPASGAFAKRTAAYLTIDNNVKSIAERKDRAAAELVPAVAFHFMPADRQSSRFVRGPIAGVSFDGTNPLVIGGYGWTYEQNVNLSFGLLARKERILLAKYEVGQVAAAELTEDQLTEMGLRIRPYISLTFRMSSSPFTKEKGKEVEKREGSK